MKTDARRFCKEASCIESGKRSVAAIVFNGEYFLLAKRKNSGKMGGRWEFIGGKVEKNETLENALVREFKEELGVLISAGSVICSTQFESEEGASNLYAIVAVLPPDFSIKGLCLNEHSEAAWFRIEEIPSLNLVDSDRKLLPGIKKWVLANS